MNEFESWFDFKFKPYKHNARYKIVALMAWLEATSRADKRVTELEDRLFALGAMDDPPCFCCGYSGSGYYHPEKHKCAERHHRLARKEG